MLQTHPRPLALLHRISDYFPRGSDDMMLNDLNFSWCLFLLYPRRFFKVQDFLVAKWTSLDHILCHKREWTLRSWNSRKRDIFRNLAFGLFLFSNLCHTFFIFITFLIFLIFFSVKLQTSLYHPIPLDSIPYKQTNILDNLHSPSHVFVTYKQLKIPHLQLHTLIIFSFYFLYSDFYPTTMHLWLAYFCFIRFLRG